MVAVGRTEVPVGGIASGVGEEQEMRRRRQKEDSRRQEARLCMDGF
jgi:hypothetical protein